MPVSLLFSIRDAKNRSSLVEVNLPTGTTVTAAQDMVDDLAPLIEALIRGAIDRAGICVTAALPAGLRTTPLDHSDVEEGARFIFNSVGGYTTSLRIPTIDETIILPNSPLVDLTNTDVSAFVTAMVSGTGGALPTDYRGADIISLRSAREAFQRSRRVTT